MFELSVYFWVVDMLESVLSVVTLVDYIIIGFVNLLFLRDSIASLALLSSDVVASAVFNCQCSGLNVSFYHIENVI